MLPLEKKLRAAIVQASPVMFNKKATLDKVVQQIRQASQEGAQLIVFPESLVPCYPYGLTFGFNVGSRSEKGRIDWKRYYDNAVIVPYDIACLKEAAINAQAYVSIGITERDSVNCSLYCSNLVISPEGKIVAHHRKIKPTGAERYIWADSHDKSTYFPIAQTPWGPMGTLICWENYMPLARVALYEKASPSTWHLTRTIILNGRTRLNTLQSKVIASSLTWTSTSRKICIPVTCYHKRKSLA